MDKMEQNLPRIKAEYDLVYEALEKEVLDGMNVEISQKDNQKNYKVWEVEMNGPEGTEWAGAILRGKLTFDDKYPL